MSKIDKNRIWKYLIKDKKLFFVVIFISIINAILTIVVPKIWGEAINNLSDIVVSKEQINFEYIIKLMIFALVFTLIGFIIKFININLIVSYIEKDLLYIRNDIAKKIKKLPISYFEKNSEGNILAIIVNDVNVVGSSLTVLANQLINAVILFVGIIVIMFIINWIMAIIVLLTLPLSVVLIGITMKNSKKYFTMQQESVAKANIFVDEYITGIDIVKAYNKENKTIEDYEKINKDLYNSSFKSTFLTSLMNPIVLFCNYIGQIGILICGTYLAIKRIIKIGDILVFLKYLQNISEPLQQFGSIGSASQQLNAASERIINLLDEKEESIENDNNFDEKINNVNFENISFGYDDEKMIIKNFSLNVEKGKKIAIVGPTGSGKTTLIKLLMRFYDVNGGSIKVNEKNIKNINRQMYRQNYAMVLQETWLFNGTVEENIKFGVPNATHEDVVKAAKMARCDDFINLLPKEYDFVIKEDAKNLSIGQKQLLTIARAFLKDSDIIILDEATSSVDIRTEKKIQQAMEELMKDKTTFVIAHRLSTIKNADVILVLKDGDIVEIGNHNELMEKKGFYYDLYSVQFESEEEN